MQTNLYDRPGPERVGGGEMMEAGKLLAGSRERPASGDLSENHKKLLAERSISVKTALAAGLRSVSSREAKAVLNFDPKSDGLLIPYFHPVSGATRTFRFRPNAPFTVNGKAAKYLSPRGVGNLLYFPPGIGERLRQSAEPVLFTEGEFKALAALEAGLLAVGLIGVWGWKARGADGGSQIVPDLDSIEVRGRGVTILFDSDVTLNAQVKRARHALAKELYCRGASTVRAIDLPAADGLKIGLDDFLAAHGVDALFDLDAFELPPTDLPPFLEPVSMMLNSPEEPLEWGIEGIQPAGASGFRIAGPKVGKSWDMAEEAYCLATAQPLYGRFRVPQRHRVAIIEEEDPRRRLKRRLERIIRAHGGVVPSDEFFRASVKKGFRLDVPAWREVLEFEVKSWRPEFVYLDVFTRLHAKDINDAAAMAEIVLFLDQLSRDYGAAFVILHHTRKNRQGGDDHDEIMGSRVLGGFSEATLFFTKTKEKGLLRVNVALKDEPEGGTFEPEFLIRLADTEDGQGTRFEYLGPPAEKAAGLEFREGVRVALEAAGDWQSVKQVAEAVKCAKPTARDCLNTLVDLKLVERKSHGQAYVYRPKTPENGSGSHA